MQGKVKSFDEIKGIGKIMGDDGEEFFFEEISINVEGFRKLVSGQPVKFTVYEGVADKERVATNVTLVF
ncbi:protein CspD [Planococcus antarcticus DSM 14505]|uniref:Cold-shock protein n=1 Tax=Planococcus antarcticus DSM 14505 TaxID=1185653 RepID=A0A1C7DH52_9BACL|nr:cold shock domain-containing protein [Planococcus antarcticus]ANU10795.1 cold-shock protein [Planococcus antarcticus DSM 14505]EIM05137.1 protein CspD [Planococcus antarcticus DSM 14505]